jgi:hypothetical protein
MQEVWEGLGFPSSLDLLPLVTMVAALGNHLIHRQSSWAAKAELKAVGAWEGDESKPDHLAA